MTIQGKKRLPSLCFFVLIILLVLPLVSAADSDGDGSDTTDPNPDCDDTNASILPPRAGLVVNRSMLFCAGSYTLNATNQTDAVLGITANNTVLDCNGSTITGNITGYLVESPNDLQGITVKNCNVINYSVGFQFGDITDSIVENNVLKNITNISISLSPAGGTISNITVRNNSMANTTKGISMGGATDTVVDNNTVSGGIVGIEFATNFARQGITLTNNVVSVGGLGEGVSRCYGMQLGSTADSTIINNTADFCEIAFFINNADSLTFQDNDILFTVDETMQQGIRLRNVTNSVVTGNTAPGVGLSMGNGCGNLTLQNNVYANGPGGGGSLLGVSANNVTVTNEILNGTFLAENVNNSVVGNITLRSGRFELNGVANTTVQNISADQPSESGNVLLIIGVDNITVQDAYLNRSFGAAIIEIFNSNDLRLFDVNATNLLLSPGMFVRDTNNSRITDITISGGALPKSNINISRSNNILFGNISVSTGPEGAFLNQSSNITLINLTLSSITGTALSLVDSLSTTINGSTFSSTATEEVVIFNQTSSGQIAYNGSIAFTTDLTISDVVTISNNFIQVNSTAASNLNNSANISIVNLGFTPGRADVDLVDNGTFANCPESRCTNENLRTDSLNFNAASFTTYIANGCVALTDNMTIETNTTICPGSYFVNDTNADGRIVLFNTSDVFLDCAESNVTGNLSNTSLFQGDDDPQMQGVEIRNCNLFNYTRAVEFSSSSNLNVKNTSIRFSTIGVDSRANNTILDNVTMRDTTYFFNMSNAFKLSIGNSTFSNTSLADDASTIAVINVDNVTFSNNNLYNVSANILFNAITNMSATDNVLNITEGLQFSTTTNAYVARNTFDNSIFGTIGLDWGPLYFSQEAVNTRVINNTFENSLIGGLKMDVSGALTNSTIQGNTWINTSAIDVDSPGTYNVTVFNNSFIRVQLGLIIRNGTFVTVQNNTFINRTNQHITLEDTVDTLIDSNTFFGSGEFGITTIQTGKISANLTILSNTFENIGTTGVHLVGENHTVRENTFVGILTGQTPLASVNLTDVVSSLVEDNTFSTTSGPSADVYSVAAHNTSTTVIQNNTANTSSPFRFRDSTGMTLSDNTLFASRTAVRLIDSLQTSINTSTINSSASSDIFVINESSSGSISYNVTTTFTSSVTLSDVVNISNNFIQVNSTAANELNQSAHLALVNLAFNISGAEFDLEDDGTFSDCPGTRCTNEVKGSGVLSFDVSSFTTYRADSCTALTDDLTINTDTTLCRDSYTVPDAGVTGVVIFNASDIFLDCDQSNVTGNNSGTFVIGQDNSGISTRNCNVYNYSVGVHYSNVNHSVVGNNTIQDMTNVSIRASLFSSDGADNVTIINNTMINASDSGVYSLNGSNLTIVGNTIRDSNNGVTLWGVRAATVQNNIFRNTTSCFRLNVVNLNDIVFGTDVDVSSNLFDTCPLAIRAERSFNVTIRNNSLMNTSGQGIRLRSINNSLIEGNDNNASFSMDQTFGLGNYNITIGNNTQRGGFDIRSTINATVTNESISDSLLITNLTAITFDNITVNTGRLQISDTQDMSLSNTTVWAIDESGNSLLINDVTNVTISQLFSNRSFLQPTAEITGADQLTITNSTFRTAFVASLFVITNVNNSFFTDLVGIGDTTAFSRRLMIFNRSNNVLVDNVTLQDATKGILLGNSTNLTLTNLDVTLVDQTVLELRDSLQTTLGTTDYSSSASQDIVIINESVSGSISYNTTINFSSNILVSDVVNISNNFIRVNSTAANNLNRSAHLALVGLSFTPADIAVDMEDDGTFIICPSATCTDQNFGASTAGFNVVSFTTYSATAATPPNVTNLVPTSGTNFNVSASIEVAANVTDDFGVSTVYANVTFPNGTISQVTLTNASNGEEFNGTFTIPKLLGTFNITFFANDTAGNINATESTNFVAVDQIPPNVSVVNPSAGSSINTTSVVIAANVTDNMAVDTVYANVTLPNGSVSQVTLTNVSGGVEFNNTYSIPQLLGTYTIALFANDTSSNTNTSEATNFTVSCFIPTNDLVVVNDLTLCSGTYAINDSGLTGIVLMNNSDITLTCDSTVLSGNSSGQGIVDASQATTGITVGNCTLRNYNKGLSFGTASNSTVTNNTVQNSTSEGIFLGNLTNSTLTLNTVSNASQALHVSSTTDAVIQENTLSSNTEGILVTSSTNATVINNQTGTTGTALHITNSLSTIVNRSLFSSSAVQDVVVLQRNPGTIRYNDTVNLTTGLQLSDAVTITNNFIRVNSTFAPQLNQSANITFASLSTAPELIQVDLNDSGSFVTCNATRCNQTTLGSSTARTVVTSFTTYRTFGTPPTGSTGGSGGSDGRPEPQPEQAPKDKEKDITCEPILTGDVNVKKAVRYRKNIYSGRIIINNICIDYLNYANFYSNSAQDERDIKFYDFKDYPTGIIPLDRPLFAVFDIGLSAQVDDRNLGFRVPVEWIEENNMQIEDVELMAYTRDWEVLPSVYLYNRMEGDKEWAHFESPLPSFSYMVIVGKKYGDLGINVQGDAVKEFGPKAEEPKGFWKDPKTYLWLLILLLVLGVCGTTGYYMYDRYKITGEIPTLKDLFLTEEHIAKNAPKKGSMHEEMDEFIEGSDSENKLKP